jgi:hypothetical protein
MKFNLDKKEVIIDLREESVIGRIFPMVLMKEEESLDHIGGFLLVSRAKGIIQLKSIRKIDKDKDIKII